MKDIKKHLDDFCRIMCQFAGETWNACKCFWNGVKPQMTAETEACLRLKPCKRCRWSGRDTFSFTQVRGGGAERVSSGPDICRADLLVAVLQQYHGGFMSSTHPKLRNSGLHAEQVWSEPSTCRGAVMMLRSGLHQVSVGSAQSGLLETWTMQPLFSAFSTY